MDPGSSRFRGLCLGSGDSWSYLVVLDPGSHRFESLRSGSRDPQGSIGSRVWLTPEAVEGQTVKTARSRFVTHLGASGKSRPWAAAAMPRAKIPRSQGFSTPEGPYLATVGFLRLQNLGGVYQGSSRNGYKESWFPEAPHPERP